MTMLTKLEEFTAEAREFVGKHAQRRTDTFRWGEGSDVIPFFEGIEDDETALKRGREWARTRYDAGYGWITGPTQYGGRELPPAYELAYRIIESEHEVADTSHLELGWGSPGLGYAHLHDRHVDVGEAGNRQFGETHPTKRDEHHKQHQRGHGLADRPSRDVPLHPLPR